MDSDKWRRKYKFQKVSAILLVVLFFVPQVASFLFISFPVYATVPAPLASTAVARVTPNIKTEEMASIPKEEEKVEDIIVKAILSAILGSLVNMASYFMRTLAYDTATYLATSGKGQGSLIFEKPFDEYLAEVAGDSLGEAISSLGKTWGLDLCAPPDLKLNAQLKIGLDATYGQPGAGPKSNCKWRDFKENWKKGPEISVDIDVAADFLGETNIMETDFGFVLGGLEQLDELKYAKEEAAKLARQVGEGFKSVTDKISGYINTPGKIIMEEATALTGKHQGQMNLEQTAGMYASELWMIIPMSASLFLNTLTSQLLTRLFTKGLVPSEQEKGQGAFDFYATNSVISRRQVIQRSFGFLTASTGTKDPAEYDIVAEFSVCPQSLASRGLNNCVMSDGIKKALDRASIGRPVTLWEAVFVDGLISQDMPLISPRRVPDNEDPNCYKDKLCYSNIQKMRKARILPLGFEVAALLSDPDNPWTIGQVLKGFEDCPDPDPDGSIKVDKAKYPFCHLIDPNWILRAPQARCENRVYSQELLLDKSSKRRSECVDVSTCISEDKNGNCTTDNYYGFCMQEKKVWNIPGDSCQKQFATCRTLTNRETNNVVSYLARTIEYGSCNSNTVGCRPYVTEQTFGTSTWIGTKDTYVWNKLFGRQQALHFNERIVASGASCPQTADGCSKFIGAERDKVTGAYIKNYDNDFYAQDPNRERFIKQAPTYLGCYDTNNSANFPEINYPTTLQQIKNNLPNDSRCDGYANVCLEEEVGCELYTPSNIGESVPGVVGDNFCPASCVGYSTFKQEKSNFESSIYPLYFIPSNGTECSAQHVGCDEFTNISSIETGGEKLEYYTYIKQCEVPKGDNSSVYYSWEGSETQGFVLKVHTLSKVGKNEYYNQLLKAGQISEDIFNQFTPESPVYADDIPVNLVENYNLCNEELYYNTINNISDEIQSHADCRALYDKEGVVYYRLLSKTVTVSGACHPIRKTKSRLEVDKSLAQLSYGSLPDLAKQICDTKKGYWGFVEEYPLEVCQRCAGGGSWVSEDPSNPEKGSCIYYGIDAPGESVSCIPEASGCRAYTGNSGNNIKPIFDDSFEPEGKDAEALNMAKKDWSPSNAVSITSESLQVNLHSLSITSGSVVKRSIPLEVLQSGAGETIKYNSSYELRFWARGSTQNVSIALEQGDKKWKLTNEPITNTDIPVSIGSNWREYTVGPVIFTGNFSDPLYLVFESSVNKASDVYFIDNVLLYRTDGTKSLIKDSWKTSEGYDAPLQCFAQNQDPMGPFPGAGLGCQEYKTSLSQTVYATGFERLCREKAVGCAPLWDTQNTAAPQAEVYNALCKKGIYTFSSPSGPMIADAEAVKVDTLCKVIIDGKDYSCTINARSNTCSIPGPIPISSNEFLSKPFGSKGYVHIKGKTDETFTQGSSGFFALIDESSVYIPADTPTDKPIYLTDTPDSSCAKKYLGCELVALEEQTTPDKSMNTSFKYQKQTVINRPDQYLGSQGTLCTSEQVACSEFSSANGSTMFFKDPEANANKLCEYKEPIGASTLKTAGWYMKNIGRCSSDDKILCTDDKACGEGGSCKDKGSIPCYENYFEDFASYGLWSNGSNQYKGFVGECPAGQNLCTEFVDPYDIDTSKANPKKKPYYVIFDNKVTDSIGECQGQVSLREGCVLFDQTENPNKSYNVSSTYEASEVLAKSGKNNTLVTPISTSNNDANLILKVKRGRECSEWLDCGSYMPSVDKDGREIDVCHEFVTCREYKSGKCVSLTQKNLDPERAFLDWKNYINRNTDWFGEERTGYSLFNSFQIGDLTKVSIVMTEDKSNNYLTEGKLQEFNEMKGVDTNSFYLAYKISDDYLKNKNLKVCDYINWQKCGFDNRGRCLNGACILPFGTQDKLGKSGFSDDTAEFEQQLSAIALRLGAPLCKVPPEETSPFPLSAVGILKGEDNKLYAGEDPQLLAKEEKKIDPNTPTTTLFRKVFSSRENSANICQFGTCECAYTAITYSAGITDYWPQKILDKGFEDKLSSYGLCSSGDDEGRFCVADSECGSGSNCQKITNIITKLGSIGNCLQYDDSRPLKLGGDQKFACNIWYPVDVSLSNLDNYNIYPEAGFMPTVDWDSPGKNFSGYYCTEATETKDVVDNKNLNLLGVPSGVSLEVSWKKARKQIYDYFKNPYFITKPNSIHHNEKLFTLEGNGTIEIKKLGCYVWALLNPGKTNDHCVSQNAYTFFQAWAHETIGPKALVLRAESGITRDIKFGLRHCGGSTFACDNKREEHQFDYNNLMPTNNNDHSNIPLVSLLPRVYHYNIPNPTHIEDWETDSESKDNCPDADGDIYCREKQNNAARIIAYARSFGTIYYPPRIWGEVANFTTTTSYVSSQKFFDELPVLTTDVQDTDFDVIPPERYVYSVDEKNSVNFLNSATFSNIYASPGPRYTLSNSNMDRILYRSTFESIMNEADLDKVYFVPTSFPGGRQKFNPVLFDTNIYIDVQTFREELNSEKKDDKKLMQSRITDSYNPDHHISQDKVGCSSYTNDAVGKWPPGDCNGPIKNSPQSSCIYNEGQPCRKVDIPATYTKGVPCVYFTVDPDDDKKPGYKTDKEYCDKNKCFYYDELKFGTSATSSKKQNKNYCEHEEKEDYPLYLCKEELSQGFVQNGPVGSNDLINDELSNVSGCEIKEDGGKVLSYVLQKDINSVFNGEDRMQSPPWNGGDVIIYNYLNVPDILSDERNKVYRRYVVIFFDGGNYTGYASGQKGEEKLLLPWLGEVENNQVELKIPDVDIFFAKSLSVNERFCYRNTNTNWFAIGMDFNKNGEFLGYLSRYCNDYQATFQDNVGTENSNPTIWENGINLAVIAKVNNMCTEFAKVYSPGNPAKGTNKAWTNRVWRESLIEPEGVIIKNKSIEGAPYGALPSVFADYKLGADLVANSIDKNIHIRQYNFFSSKGDNPTPEQGVPYSCATPFMEGFFSVSEYKRCNFYYDEKGNINSDFNISVMVGFEEVYRDGKNRLNQLFAKFFEYIIRKKADWKGEITYDEWRDSGLMDGNNNYKKDVSDALSPGVLPPQIYSLNPHTCFTDVNSGRCTAGEANNFTINGRNGTRANYDRDEENIVDEDPYNLASPEVDYIIAPGGTYLAQASFFAFADDNRMPIRRVLVDWGDGKLITNDNVWGFYKNRKPVCESEKNPTEPGVGLCRKKGDSTPTLLTCVKEDKECPIDYECLDSGELGNLDYSSISGNLDRFDKPRFGNLPRACDSGDGKNKYSYFRYSYLYGCDKSQQKPIGEWDDKILSPYQKTRLKSYGKNNEDPICVYRPRVQVIDNWGWCNASEIDNNLTGVDVLSILNKEGQVTKAKPSVSGLYNDGKVEIEQGASPLYNCNPKEDDPWTYYKGLIIVVP